MKIKIEHISNTLNYGSLMMAVNTLVYIKNKLPNVTFFVDCSTEEDLERLKMETGICEIKKIDYIDNMYQKSKIEKLIQRIKEIRKDSQLYDLRIILGGDDISEYYGKKMWLIQFPLMFIENVTLPTIFLGQTIGPFTSYRRILAKIVLNKAKIYTRDDTGLAYIRNMGIKTAYKGRDLAFLALPLENTSNSILEKYNLLNKQYITVVPSGLTKCYTKNYSDYITCQCDFIRGIISNKYLQDTYIVLLPHVLYPKDVNDTNIIIDIEKKLDSKEKEKIIFIKDSMLASQARQILGGSLFTLTGRMHAAVSTFYMRKPAISLSYSVKYEGVIGSGLDMKELVIEAADENLWQSKEIVSLVYKKISYILENYDELVDKINLNVNQTSKMSLIELENLGVDINQIINHNKKY